MKSKDLIKAELVGQLHQQSLGLLIDALADAQVRIQELEAKLAEGDKKE